MTIHFKLEGVDAPITYNFTAGQSIMDAAKAAGIEIDAPCGGNGTCGKCKVRVKEAEVPACQTKAEDGMEVFVPLAARAFKKGQSVVALGGSRENAAFAAMRKELARLGLLEEGGLGKAALSACSLATVDLALTPPSMDDPKADRERLLDAFREATALQAKISLHTLRSLPQTLRQNNFSVKCVYKIQSSGSALILGLSRGGHTMGGGSPQTAMAIDIGTTTVAVLLFDLETGAVLATGTAGNGQIRYGADVINRIVESCKPGGLERLRKAIVEETLAPLIAEVCKTAGIESSQVLRAGLAGNTTMTHLFAGVWAEHIRLEPYVPAFFHTQNDEAYTALELGLPLNPEAEVVIAPAVGSYVGGDITAGVLTSLLYEKESVSLFMDLGTNGELVLGGSEYLMCCACSAGPAFEGGDISCGMRAAPGAIEAVSINEATMEPALTVIGDKGTDDASARPRGLCGSGLIDTIGELFRCGIINGKGKFDREGPRITADDYGMKSFTLAYAKDTATNVDLKLTEADIDNFIRAKAAIFSGIRAMLSVVGMEPGDLDHVYIAGGIGSGIDVEKAIRIGMLPKLPPEKFSYLGNTSLYGAYALAASKNAANKVNEIAGGMTYIELSSHPGYMDEFVAACFLPHTDGTLFA